MRERMIVEEKGEMFLEVNIKSAKKALTLRSATALSSPHQAALFRRSIVPRA